MNTYNILCRAVHLANILKSQHNGSARDINIWSKKNHPRGRPKLYKEERCSIGIVQEKTKNLTNFGQGSDTSYRHHGPGPDYERIPLGFPVELLHVKNTNYSKDKAAENVTVEVIARLIVDLEKARQDINAKEDLIKDQDGLMEKAKGKRLRDGLLALNGLRGYYYDLFEILMKDVESKMRTGKTKHNVIIEFTKLMETMLNPYIPDEEMANALINEFTDG